MLAKVIVAAILVMNGIGASKAVQAAAGNQTNLLKAAGTSGSNRTELRKADVAFARLAELLDTADIDAVEGGHTADLLDVAGPFGGPGGNAFSDRVVAAGRRIVGVEVGSGSLLDRIRVLYEGIGNQPVAHGGSGGGVSYFGLNACDGERITRVEIRAGSLVDGIQFFTNQGRNSPFYGGNGGILYSVNFGPGGLQYIEGRTGRVVDQLEFHF